MADIANDARACVILADVASATSDGKLNVLGLGFGLTGLQPNGMTPQQSVMAIIDVPTKYVGDEVAISLELVDLTTGTSVMMPAPNGTSQALRVQQMHRIVAPQLPGGIAVPAAQPVRLQMLINFNNGIPLTQGRSYEWRLKIEGYHRKGWTAAFSVIEPPQGPVLGGPGGPTDIPNVTNPGDLEDDLEAPSVTEEPT